MRKVVVIGHFSFKKEKLNGQTIKTKVVAQELIRRFGEGEVTCVDTAGGWRFLSRLPVVFLSALRNHCHVILMPAYKAVFILSPLLVLMNVFSRRRLHFVTIGGRLPLIARNHPFMKWVLGKFDYIYVETELSHQEMLASGLENIVVMPNCKPLSIMSLDNQPMALNEPIPLCTFSRVIESKGIAEAAEAVTLCNRQLGRDAFRLDIYGQVEVPEWFDEMMSHQPSYIQYKGRIPFAESTKVLNHYFLLLFPTYYPGECFAGTIIDALAAGVPVIASDWRSNSELVDEGCTGFLFPVHNVNAMRDILLDAVSDPSKIQKMRAACLEKAWQFLPEVVLEDLAKRME